MKEIEYKAEHARGWAARELGGRGGVALAELGQRRGRTCGIQGGGSPSSQEALCLVVERHKQINYVESGESLVLGGWAGADLQSGS